VRLRDLKWYILASIIVIISYAAISLCYYLSVKSGKVEQSMKAISLEIAQGEIITAQEKIDSLYELYVSDTNNTLIENGTLTVCSSQNGLASKFKDIEGSKYIFEREYTMIPNIFVGAPDTNYYFYFLKEDDSELAFLNGDDSKTLCARISASKFFEYMGYDFVIFDSTSVGTIGYSNSNIFMLSDGMYESIPELIGENFYENFDENGILNNTYNLKGSDRVFTVLPFLHDSNGNSLRFGITISTRDAVLGVEWVTTQALIFFIAGIVVAVIMLIILIFGCKKASQLLRADRHSVEATKTIVIRIDPHGKVIFTNKTFKKMYGVTRLNNVDEFIDVETNEPIMTIIKENRAFECSVPLEGEVRYLQLNPIYISSSYYLMGSDITIDYLRRKHLETMCGKNESTNCDNGFILSNQFNHILEANYGYDLAFIEYNIHKFDEIIAVFGQTNYNLLLNELLTIIQNTYKDLAIYHMTDSKFMVVYPNSDVEQVIAKINESLDTLQKPITVKQNNIYVQAKIVLFNLKSDMYSEYTLDVIKTKLDQAYRNMSQLTNKDYIVYDPVMDSIILFADQMEADIETGLINNEFEMHLQPQFDIVSNKVSGFEALIRWNNPKYRDKSPQQFIEIAEQRGHMLDIGRFVLTESFKLAKKLEEFNVHISVNVSPVQLLQVGFVNLLIDEFQSLNLKKGSVAIEITETLLMGNFSLVVEKLKMLKEKGFHIHLDDFCTGYSSMLYLKDLPVDTIKIDKEFTKYIETDKTHENIVRTICSLGSSLNLGIVCEGVENQTQADMIKKMGCRVIQGYLIGKAMPYDEAVVLLEKYNRK